MSTCRLCLVSDERMSAWLCVQNEGWEQCRRGKRGRLKRKPKTANGVQRGATSLAHINRKGGYTAKYLGKILVGVGRRY